MWSTNSIQRHVVRARRQRTASKFAIDTEVRQRAVPLVKWEDTACTLPKRPATTAAQVVTRIAQHAGYSCVTGCRNLLDTCGFVCNRPCLCIVCPWCCSGTNVCPGAKWRCIALPPDRRGLPRMLADPVHFNRATAAALAAFKGSVHLQMLSILSGNDALQRRAREFGVGGAIYNKLAEQQLPDAREYLSLLHIAKRTTTATLRLTELDRFCASLFRRKRVKGPRVTFGMSMLDSESPLSGLSIGKVDKDSSAGACGIIAGCVLTAVNGVDLSGSTSNNASRLMFREALRPRGCWWEGSLRMHCRRQTPVHLKPQQTSPLIPAVKPLTNTLPRWHRDTLLLRYYVAMPPQRLIRIEPRLAIDGTGSALVTSTLTLMARARELISSTNCDGLSVVVLLDKRHRDLFQKVEAMARQPGITTAAGKINDCVTALFYVNDKDVEVTRIVAVGPIVNFESDVIAIMEAARGAAYIVMTSFTDQPAADAVLKAVHNLQKESAE